MSPLTALIALALIQLLLLFAHGTFIAVTHGIRWGTGRRSVSLDPTDLDRRFERTIANTIESAVAFVPIALVALYLELDSQVSAAGAAYVGARGAFVLLYLGNVPYLRTVAWLVGQGAIAVMAVAVLRAVG